LILREELEYAEHRLQSWIVAAGAKRDRENKKAKAQQLGAGMECACCFDEFDIDDMVSCKREGHLFCVDCLQQYASTKVFGEGNLGIDKKTKEPSLDLICFHPDGCESAFERNILVKALTNDTLRKYDEIQASLAISKAGLSDLVTCPRCGFQATLAATQKVFECPCDDCRFASCRECGEAAHVPLRYVECLSLVRRRWLSLFNESSLIVVS
jgi:TRIAD3 protein (E3 ubiquitin-protein ligase RNF216)